MSDPALVPQGREPIVSVRALTKNYPIQRTDASFFARWMGRAFGWTGALDEWRPLNSGLPILKGIDLDVYADETLAIYGHSGAGKSTLLHLMGALELPSSGSISYRGRDLKAMKASQLADYRNRRVGFVFQFYYLFPDLNALENVLLPAYVAHSTLGWLGVRREFHERARELLERVRLQDRMAHKPSQLSGGEQQRVAIARALILSPELVLCDEPTGNLDRKTGEEVLALLMELKAKSGQTYVIVTHDRQLVDRADRRIELEDGRVKAPASVPVEGAASEVSSPLVVASAPVPSAGSPTPAPAPPQPSTASGVLSTLCWTPLVLAVALAITMVVHEIFTGGAWFEHNGGPKTLVLFCMGAFIAGLGGSIGLVWLVHWLEDRSESRSRPSSP